MSVCRKTERLLHRWCQCLGWGGFTREVQLGTGTGFSLSNLVFTLSFYQCAIFIHVLPMLWSLQVTPLLSDRHKNTS